MKKLIAFFLFFGSGVLLAQQDTVYFNKDWDKVGKSAAYYYLLAEPVFTGWSMTFMYSASNTPYMRVFSTQFDPLVKNGKCIYYYPNGKKYYEGYFSENKYWGVWSTWDKRGVRTDYVPKDVSKDPTVKSSIKNYRTGDTLFFDSEWILCSRARAEYYRVGETQSGGGYKIKDYYLKTNVVQMEAFTTSMEPTYMLDKATYYYPSGKKEMQGYYSDDRKTGIWLHWNEDGKDSTFSNHGRAYSRKVKFTPQELTPEQKLKDSISTYNAGRISAWDSSIVELEKTRGLDFSLRGKVASFFIIEDAFFLTYTGGAELGFRRHSLGLDYTWFRWRYEEDDSHDVGKYSQYELRNYLLADYKFTFLIMPRIDLDVYFNAYYKYGKYSMWYDQYEDFDFGTSDITFLQSTTKGMLTEPGAGFGIRKYAEKSGFGLDVSMNAACEMMDNNEKVYVDMSQNYYKEHVLTERWRPYIRMECFYNFGR